MVNSISGSRCYSLVYDKDGMNVALDESFICFTFFLVLHLFLVQSYPGILKEII